MFDILRKLLATPKKEVEPKSPTIEQRRMITAVHEAAHVVTTYISRFHVLRNDILLSNADQGLSTISISKKKILESGKILSTNIETDHEVLYDAAIIFYAGLEAEKLYGEKYNILIDDSYSKNDYNMIPSRIELAGFTSNVFRESAIAFSQKTVEKYWEIIDYIAYFLLEDKNGRTSVIDVIDILDHKFRK